MKKALIVSVCLLPLLMAQASLRRTPLKELLEGADLVVVGSINSQEGRSPNGGDSRFAYAWNSELEIKTVLKGKTKGKQVKVQWYEVSISGANPYQIKEDRVWILVQSGHGDEYTAGMQSDAVLPMDKIEEVQNELKKIQESVEPGLAAKPAPAGDKKVSRNGEIINLGRTSITTVTASSVNGKSALDDVPYGIPNAFDDGNNWQNNINYTEWLSGPHYSTSGDPKPYVEVMFDCPVTVTSIIVEDAPPFSVRLTCVDGSEKTLKAKDSLELESPIQKVQSVHLGFDYGKTFEDVDGKGGTVEISEIRILGSLPSGTEYEVRKPRIVPSRQNFDLMANVAFGFVEWNRETKVQETDDVIAYTYYLEKIPVSCVTINKKDGSKQVEGLCPDQAKRETIKSKPEEKSSAAVNKRESRAGEIINLGRTSIAAVTASSVNGDRAMNNGQCGVLNVFDVDSRSQSYTEWVCGAGDLKPYVEAVFDHPVTITSIVTEDAPRFSARFILADGSEKIQKAKGSLKLNPPIQKIQGVRLTFERKDSYEDASGGLVEVKEIRIMGSLPAGTEYEVQEPRIVLNRRNLDLMANEASSAWSSCGVSPRGRVPASGRIATVLPRTCTRISGLEPATA